MVRLYVARISPQASKSSKSARNLGDSSKLALSSTRVLVADIGDAGDKNSLVSNSPDGSEINSVLNCGSAVDSFSDRESCGGPAQQTGVALKRQRRDQILFQGDQRDSALADYKLAGIEGMFTAPRLECSINAEVSRIGPSKSVVTVDMSTASSMTPAASSTCMMPALLMSTFRFG